VNDPTLPRTGNLQCDKCSYQEVVLLQAGFGASSRGTGSTGGMSLWFVCTRCHHRWSMYYLFIHYIVCIVIDH
jgi:DNA-directed RNA polymerase subunit M/transcription elongation factor TFIIS